MKYRITAFTLVELIVVITILAILGTIGFISLQGYSVNARDSVRIADTKTYIKALNIYQTKEGEVPLPDDTTTITGSGVVFSYQGTLSGSVITALGQGTVPVDPILGTPYLYATNEGRTKFQLLSYHEKNTSSTSLLQSTSFAEASYADMFPKVIGDKIGILLAEDNSPISSGSLAIHETSSSYRYFIDNSTLIEGTGSTIIKQNPLNSCKRILDSGNSHGSDYYTVYPDGNPRLSYCDMETDGGGWTVIARSASGATVGNFGWNITRGEVDNINDAFSFGEGVKKMNFSEILIARADNFKDYNLVLKLDINPDDFMHPDYANTGTYVGWWKQEVIYTGGIPEVEQDHEHGRMFLYWGNFDVNNLYYFRDAPTSAGFGLHPYWFNTYNSGAIYGSFHQKHGMILVR